jgi:hypothetical protein
LDFRPPTRANRVRSPETSEWCNEHVPDPTHWTYRSASHTRSTADLFERGLRSSPSSRPHCVPTHQSEHDRRAYYHQHHNDRVVHARSVSTLDLRNLSGLVERKAQKRDVTEGASL